MKYIAVYFFLFHLFFVIRAETCGYQCTYTIQDGKLSIVGGGNIYSNIDDYCKEYPPWYPYRDTITSIETKDFWSIGGCAFKDFTKVTTATINAIAYLNDNAFDSCTSLKSVSLDVSNVGSEVFKDCISLTTVTLSSIVGTFRPRVFVGCTNLTTITLPYSVSYLNGIFADGSYLESIYVEGGIGEHFMSTEDGVLFKVSEPEGRTTQEKTAILVAYPPEKKSASYAIPDLVGGLPVTKIERQAFVGARRLKALSLPKTFKSSDQEAFDGLTGLVEFTDFSQNDYFVKDGILFRTISFLTSKEIEIIRYPPKKMDVVNYVIPDDVTRMSNAFVGCNQLQTINISKNFEYAYRGFNGANGLTAINVGEDSVNFIPGTVALVDNMDGVEKYPPRHPGTHYTIPRGAGSKYYSIEYRAFEQCTNLQTITIPDTITTIDHQAFLGCTSLTEITIPKNVTFLATDVFEGCTGLTKIIVEEGEPGCGCTTVDGVLFCKNYNGNNTLVKYPAKKPGTDYTIPPTNRMVTQIQTHAFESCPLASLTIPETVTTIEKEAFTDCSQLSFVEYKGDENPGRIDSFVNCPYVQKVCVPPTYKSKSFCGKPVFNCH